MDLEELAVAPWRKSSRSNGNGSNNCVEVAMLADAVAVRDSKDRQGPVLIFTKNEWRAFLVKIRAGDFTHPDGTE